MNKSALLFNLSLNELKSYLILYESSVIDLESSLIPIFFHITGVLIVLESSLIDFKELSNAIAECCKWISALSNCTHWRAL